MCAARTVYCRGCKEVGLGTVKDAKETLRNAMKKYESNVPKSLVGFPLGIYPL